MMVVALSFSLFADTDVGFHALSSGEWHCHPHKRATHTHTTLQELRVPEVSDEGVAHVETLTKVAAARCGREAVWAAEKERRRCGD